MLSQHAADRFLTVTVSRRMVLIGSRTRIAKSDISNRHASLRLPLRLATPKNVRVEPDSEMNLVFLCAD